MYVKRNTKKLLLNEMLFTNKAFFCSNEKKSYKLKENGLFAYLSYVLNN
jgi:hypothetical protein